jgi:hypothetical protein
VQGLTTIKSPESESSTTITREREAARLRLQVLDNLIFESLRGQPTAGIGVRIPPPITPELRNALLNRRAEIARIETDLRRQVRGELEGQFSCTATAELHASGLSGAQRQEADRATQRKGAEAEQKIAQAARLTTITGDGRLLNNNLEAFYITSAPERFWAPRYNRAFGRGVFGSSSIAIVMNETADFSVKGFVFDARSTAQMVQKVGTQAVSMIAAAHGAPILPRAPGATTGGPTQFSTTDAISTNQMTVERAEAEQEAYEVAMVRVADSILSNWTSLTSAAGTARTSASTVVSGTIRAYENSWRTTQPQPKQ